MQHLLAVRGRMETGMRVTQIVELSKSRSKIYIEQEFAFVLYKGELRLYHVREGEELSEEDYRTIVQEVLPKRAKLRAMNLLTGREYTTAQLRTKLKQGYYPDDVIEEALAYVASFHYTDDLRFAYDYISYNADTKSRRRIEQDLQNKGISVELIEQAWSAWEAQGEAQDEQSMIEALLRKKHFAPETADYKEKQKIYGFLMRKGFSGESVRKVLSYTGESM